LQQARQLRTGERLISPAEPVRHHAPVQMPGSRLKKVKLLLIFFTCFMLSVAVVAQYSSLVMLNYRLGKVRHELAAVKETSHILELEAGKLGAIGRIEEIARADLGMVEPEISQIKVLTARKGAGN